MDSGSQQHAHPAGASTAPAGCCLSWVVESDSLAVKLSAEFQGDFSAITEPDFDLPAPPKRGIRRGDIGPVPFMVYIFGLLLVSAILGLHAGWIPGILAVVAWLFILGMTVRRDLRHRDDRARDADPGARQE